MNHEFPQLTSELIDIVKQAQEAIINRIRSFYDHHHPLSVGAVVEEAISDRNMIDDTKKRLMVLTRQLSAATFFAELPRSSSSSSSSPCSQFDQLRDQAMSVAKQSLQVNRLVKIKGDDEEYRLEEEAVKRVMVVVEEMKGLKEEFMRDYRLWLEAPGEREMEREVEKDMARIPRQRELTEALEKGKRDLAMALVMDHRKRSGKGEQEEGAFRQRVEDALLADP